MIVIIFVFSLTSLNAQTKTDLDYQTYKKIFEKEIKKIQGSENGQIETHELFFSKLPEWFIYATKKMNAFDVIGISNPGLDSTAAMQQAVIRACGLAFLYNRCIFQCMTHSFKEFYPTLKENILRFVSLNSLETDPSSQPVNFKIIKKVILPTQEAIVEIAFEKKPNIMKQTPNFRLHLDFYTQLERKNTTESLQSKIDWRIIDINGRDTLSDVFNLYGIQPAYFWNSSFGSVLMTSDSLKYNFFYWADDTVSNKSQENQSYSLKQGLWPAYLNAIVNNIVFSAYNRQCRTDIQSLSDFYSLKTVSFSQIINSDTISGLFPKFYFRDNQLSVKSVNP
ncbi:MAG: hypothetical protein IH595_04305 [Bacteroidales bacterium]|nr:hypothetical protein [Bacteroidales bacterium]